MKRELDLLLEGQSNLSGSLGRTRSLKLENSPCNGVSDRSGFAKRSPGSKARVNKCDGVEETKRNKRLKTSLLKSESKNNEAKSSIEESASEEKLEADLGQCGNKEDVKDVMVNSPRRFTRSVLKPELAPEEVFASPTGVSILTESVVDEKTPSVVDEKTPVAISSRQLRTPENKLELKMTKKVGLSKIPSSIQELFLTGLLEGYPIRYGRRDKRTAIRGTINGLGILCRCKSCKGCAVFLPSQFELHVLHKYRRAAMSIYLDNGKNLLMVLEACQRASVETLEATIQDAIGPVPVKTSTTCFKCKCTFSSTHAATEKQLCNSCIRWKFTPVIRCASLENSHKMKIQTPATRDRSLKKSQATTLVRRGGSLDYSQAMTSQTPLTKVRSLKNSQLTRSQTPITRERVSKRSHSTSSHTPARRGRPPKNSLALTTTQPHAKRDRSSKNSQATTSPSPIARLRSSKSVPALNKSVPALKSPDSDSPQQKGHWKVTKKDHRLHRLVFEEGGLPEGTEVAYYVRGKKMLEGYKRGFGIFCRCCNTEISASSFEAHAGFALRKKPYSNIYTSNGVSLHELALLLSKGRKFSSKDNDDLCTVCKDGGDLLLCDGCPRAFHKECVKLPIVPEDSWYCKICQNIRLEKVGLNSENAVAAGRVEGVDPIEQIAKRCIRIVENIPEAEVSACVLCSGYDFSKSAFGPRTIIICDQCEMEFHVGCLKDHNMADLRELPEGEWYCSADCRRIRSTLQKLLVRGSEKLPDTLLTVIKQKIVTNGSDTADLDVRWRVLSGKFGSPETRSLLSKAVTIFHDCFDPIVDVVSGRDLIPSMVYGRSVRGQDFGGMYCAILTVNTSIVSVGIFRVLGREVAELPLVATCNNYQAKGYFQSLFFCIERLLAFLKVKSFLLPAACEAEAIWTDKFGFTKICPDKVSKYKKSFQMTTFQGTSMLEKMIPECRILQST